MRNGEKSASVSASVPPGVNQLNSAGGSFSLTSDGCAFAYTSWVTMMNTM
jgi:hypothetical protein